MTDTAQGHLLPDHAWTPERVLEEADRRHGPFVARVCLFSGGNDSLAVAHRCRDSYDFLCFIDTGTAVPGVREFVEEAAAWLDKPLRIAEAGDEYERMVLGIGTIKTGARAGQPEEPLGFPGPGMHGRAYNRLKERSIEALQRDLKTGHPRSARVLLVTGIRRAESQRRAARPPILHRGGRVFISPLIEWTSQDLRAYRARHRLPESDVAALLHRSGECNCGAYAAPGEREELRSLYPEWFDGFIGRLEREAVARGIPACRWGAGGAPAGAILEAAGPLCSDCELRLDLGAA